MDDGADVGDVREGVAVEDDDEEVEAAALDVDDLDEADAAEADDVGEAVPWAVDGTAGLESGVWSVMTRLYSVKCQNFESSRNKGRENRIIVRQAGFYHRRLRCATTGLPQAVHQCGMRHNKVGGTPPISETCRSNPRRDGRQSFATCQQPRHFFPLLRPIL